MSPRRVHYAAHGVGALTFECFRTEMRAHLDSKQPADPALPWHDKSNRQYAVPCPGRSTDLRKVTCATCWDRIAKLALQVVKQGVR